MLHTANLMLSGGLGTPGLIADLQAGEEAGNGLTRPKTRKSQIIMEEEDDMEEDIEEVDAFSSPEAIETSFENEAVGQDKKYQEPALEAGETPATAEDHKPVLAPAPDLEPSSGHPSRSSLNGPELQRDPRSGIDETEEYKPSDPADMTTQPAERTALVNENEEDTAGPLNTKNEKSPDNSEKTE
jgi:hypothetical protein